MADKKIQKICAICKAPLEYIGLKQFHEGRRWGVLGDLGELAVSREWLKMYKCPSCQKIDFYQAEPPPSSEVQRKSLKQSFGFMLKVLVVALIVVFVILILGLILGAWVYK